MVMAWVYGSDAVCGPVSAYESVSAYGSGAAARASVSAHVLGAAHPLDDLSVRPVHQERAYRPGQWSRVCPSQMADYR